jgi:hypothetical protein
MRDDHQVTSELYRLMPPRQQRTELQEALDAAVGAPTALDAGDNEDRPPGRRGLVLPRAIRSASRHTLVWLGSVVTLTLAGVLSLVIYGYLTRH